MFDHSTIFWL